MRRLTLIALTVCVFAVLNVAIYQKEQIRRDGETVFLELAPVDPRSLMQGDYMQLQFAIEREMPRERGRSEPKRGEVVVAVDQNSVARFVRLHQGETLQPGEKLMQYSSNGWSSSIRPNSFFFQEGQREVYERAKYGQFKFAGDSDYILIGLAAEDRTALAATANP
jgi:uncharacterized membrane-anchored protein